MKRCLTFEKNSLQAENLAKGRIHIAPNNIYQKSPKIHGVKKPPNWEIGAPLSQFFANISNSMAQITKLLQRTNT